MTKPRNSAPARDAVLKLFNGRKQIADIFLACLWLAGFKVVPLEEADEC